MANKQSYNPRTQIRRPAARLFLFLISVSALHFRSNAQSTDNSLSLKEAVALAMEANHSLVQSREQTAVAKANRQEGLGVFLPTLSLSETALFTNSPLNAFGYKLLQESVTNSDFNPALLNNPGDVSNFVTSADLTLPLVNVDGWKQQAATQAGVRSAEYQNRSAEAQVTLRVKQVYFAQELASKSKKVIDQAVETAKATLKFTEDNASAGYVQKTDVLAVKIKLSELESQQQQAEHQIQHLNEQLSLLLGKKETQNWVLTDSIAGQSEMAITGESYSSSTILAIEQGVLARTAMHDATKLGLLPRINAFASYSLYSSETLFGNSGNNYLVGVRAQWDVFTGLRRSSAKSKSYAEMKIASSQLDQYKSQTEMEVLQTQRNIAILEKELASAALAIDQSQEAFELTNNRFMQGLERVTDLLNAQTMRSQQLLRHTQTTYNLLMAKAKLTYLNS